MGTAPDGGKCLVNALEKWDINKVISFPPICPLRFNFNFTEMLRADEIGREEFRSGQTRSEEQSKRKREDSFWGPPKKDRKRASKLWACVREKPIGQSHYILFSQLETEIENPISKRQKEFLACDRDLLRNREELFLGKVE